MQHSTRPSTGLEAAAAPVFVLLWSTGFIGAKYGLPYAEPATFLALRFALAASLLALWVWLVGAPWPTWRQAGQAAVIGILLHAIYLGGIYQGIALGIEAGLSALIVALQPVFTALAARQFLGERLVSVQWGGIGLGCAGVSLVVVRKIEAGFGTWWGVAFCLFSLVAIVVATVMQKRLAGNHPMRSTTAVQLGAACLFLAPLSMVFETGEIAWTAEFGLSLAWLVLALSLGGWTLFLYLLRRGAASQVATLFFLVPPATALMAWPLFGETLGLAEIAGVAMTAFGVLMVNRPDLFSRG